MKHKWMRALALVLAIILVTVDIPWKVSADEEPIPTCEIQTGMSELYEYDSLEIGHAGTAYLNTFRALLHLRRTDLDLGGNRLPITVEFYYDSENILDEDVTQVNPYGRGWATSFHQFLTYDSAEQRYTYINENGTRIHFVDSQEVTEDLQEIWREDTTLGVGATGAVLYVSETDKDVYSEDIHHLFDASGRLCSLEDDYSEVSIQYNGTSSSQIERVTDAVGRQYVFSYDNGSLSEIACFDSSNQPILIGSSPIAVSYSIVNGEQRTVSFTDAESVSYSYDTDHRLIRAADIDHCGYSFTYDGSTDCVAQVTRRAGMDTALEEAGTVITVQKTGTSETAITADGVQVQYDFDACGRVLQLEMLTEETGAGASPQSAGGSASTYSLYYGYQVTYGNVEEEDGSVVNTAIEIEAYDADGMIVDETEEETTEEETTEEEVTYDDSADVYGNTLSETTVNGDEYQEISFTYDSQGNYPTSRTDENGITESYSYHAGSGLLESLTDGAGSTTTYSYNALRELEAVHLDMTSIPGGMEAEYTYDEGRLTDLEYGSYAYHFTYDIWGNVLDVAMNGSPLVSYNYGSDAYKGLVQFLTYGNGQQVFYSYNALGLVSAVGYTGQTNRFLYSYDSEGTLTEIYDSVTGETTTYTADGYEISKNNSVLYESEKDSEGVLGTVSVLGVNRNTLMVASSAEKDAFGRISRKSQNKDEVRVSSDYHYETDSDGKTRTLPDELTVRYVTGHPGERVEWDYEYAYDSNGNLSSEHRTELRTLLMGPAAGEQRIGGNAETQGIENPNINLPEPTDLGTVEYEYDEAGQLTRAEDSNGILWQYSYDASGNILTASKTEETASGTNRTSQKAFQYTNGLLTGYTKDGTTVSYQNDSMGNPILISENGSETELTWGEGRMLTEVSASTLTISYTYNAEGLRVSKTVFEGRTPVVTEYVWGEEGLAGLRCGEDTLVLIYNEEGEAIGFDLNGETYQYVKNLQGDVLCILNEAGEKTVSYRYDPWGKPEVSGDYEIADLNPCSYRGYDYDEETGYYYLQSRYYDPEIGRFLNADAAEYLDSTPLLGDNLFLYCNNAPIIKEDRDGHFSIILGGLIISFSAAQVIAFALSFLAACITFWVLRSIIKNLIPILISFCKELGRAVDAVVQRAKSKAKKKGTHKHHIIARTADRAKKARDIWTKECGQSINASINLIRISINLHAPLHTIAYYEAVNNLVGKGMKRNGKSGVVTSLIIIRFILKKADAIVR